MENHFEIYTGKDNLYYWRYWFDGNVIATGHQGYVSKSLAEIDIKNLQNTCPIAATQEK